MDEQPICDLCSEPAVRWSYPARDFIETGVISPSRVLLIGSSGGWAACDECHQLIEADDRAALLKRSVENFVAFYGVRPPTLADDIRRIHEQFFANRRGPAVELATFTTCRRVQIERR